VTYFTTLHEIDPQWVNYGLQFTRASGRNLFLERHEKGSVLFHDPEDPNRDPAFDESEEPYDVECDRWHKEEEEDRKKGGSIGQRT